MFPDQELLPYEVEIKTAIRYAFKSRVYEIPLEEPILNRIEELTTSKWFARLACHPEDAWQERLVLGEHAGEAERIVARALTSFRPKSIVVCDDKIWCGIVPRICDDRKSLYFLGERFSSGVNTAMLRKNGFLDPDQIASFLEMLSGFRELMYPEGGHFEDFNRRNVLYDQEMTDKYFSGFVLKPDWDPSISIFISNCSDTILMNRKGEFGWWEAGSWQAVIPFRRSLTSLAIWIQDVWTVAAEGHCKQLEIGRTGHFDIPRDEGGNAIVGFF